MIAAQLLTHFDRLADAPDAIPRLRRFILDLAVRGKLVPQNPNDEPASELLKQVAAEKARLVEAGEIRKQETEQVTTEEYSFKLPLNWSWSRLGVIGDWGSGSTPRRGVEELYGGGITWLKSGELNDNPQLLGSEETVTTTAVEGGSFRENQPGDVLLLCMAQRLERSLSSLTTLSLIRPYAAVHRFVAFSISTYSCI